MHIVLLFLINISIIYFINNIFYFYDWFFYLFIIINILDLFIIIRVKVWKKEN